jgi:hypothetical protein
MKHPKAVLDKICTITKDSIELRKACIRIPKYESRGFTIKKRKLSPENN